MLPVLSKKDQKILYGDFCFRGFRVWVSWPSFSYGDAVEGVCRLEGNLASVLCHFVLDCATSYWLCRFRLVPEAESERAWL